MTPAAWGLVLGAGVGVGLLTVVVRVLALRRPLLAVRVLPYLRDLPQAERPLTTPRAPSTALGAVFGPALASAADSLERVLGGNTSIRRRLERAALPLSVHDFRVEQVLWGTVGFAATAALSLVVALRSPGRTLPLLVLCGVAFVLGVLLRENRLSAQVKQRETRVLAEFPTVAELLALAVGAGEGPVSALDRVVTRSRGELSRDLARVLAEVRTGTPVSTALDDLARRSGLPVVARFAEGMAVAIERGTPLSAVLHAQAADVREAGRRALIESGARKEVAMMVPVVFLVLPVTVVFTFLLQGDVLRKTDVVPQRRKISCVPQKVRSGLLSRLMACSGAWVHPSPEGGRSPFLGLWWNHTRSGIPANVSAVSGWGVTPLEGKASPLGHGSRSSATVSGSGQRPSTGLPDMSLARSSIGPMHGDLTHAISLRSGRAAWSYHRAMATTDPRRL